MRLEQGCHPTSVLSMLNESWSCQKNQVHNRTTICGEEPKTEMISEVKRHKIGNNSHGEELKTGNNTHGEELNTTQYANDAWWDDTELYTWWTETKEDKRHDNQRWIFCILSEKEEWYPIQAMDYPAVIEMNRRIPMQIITPVSTWLYDSHLEENNEGKCRG